MKTTEIKKMLEALEVINGDDCDIEGIFIINPDDLRFYQSGNIEPSVCYEVINDKVFIDGDSRY